MFESGSTRPDTGILRNAKTICIEQLEFKKPLKNLRVDKRVIYGIGGCNDLKYTVWENTD
jgi:hypothetical protein